MGLREHEKGSGRTWIIPLGPISTAKRPANRQLRRFSRRQLTIPNYDHEDVRRSIDLGWSLGASRDVENLAVRLPATRRRRIPEARRASVARGWTPHGTSRRRMERWQHIKARAGRRRHRHHPLAHQYRFLDENARRPGMDALPLRWAARLVSVPRLLKTSGSPTRLPTVQLSHLPPSRLLLIEPSR